MHTQNEILAARILQRRYGCKNSVFYGHAIVAVLAQGGIFFRAAPRTVRATLCRTLHSRVAQILAKPSASPGTGHHLPASRWHRAPDPPNRRRRRHPRPVRTSTGSDSDARQHPDQTTINEPAASLATSAFGVLVKVSHGLSDAQGRVAHTRESLELGRHRSCSQHTHHITPARAGSQPIV